MKAVLLLMLITCLGHKADAIISFDQRIITPDMSVKGEKPPLDPAKKWKWHQHSLCYHHNSWWQTGSYWCQAEDTNHHRYWQELHYVWYKDNFFTICFLALCMPIIALCVTYVFLLLLSGLIQIINWIADCFDNKKGE